MSKLELKIATEIADIIEKYLDCDEDLEALLKVWVKMSGGIISSIINHEGRADPEHAATAFSKLIKDSILRESAMMNNTMSH